MKRILAGMINAIFFLSLFSWNTSLAAVNKAPTIYSFTANPANISSGQSTTLSWSVGSATSVSLDQGIGTVSGLTGSIVVAPSNSLIYTLTARNSFGTKTASVSIAVTPLADTTPPIISSIGSSGITQTGASISWTTNESSDSQIEYGTTTSYGSSTSLNSSLVTSHSVNLSGLTANTLYHFRVKSKDAAGNLAVSSDQTFTTQSGGSIVPLAQLFNNASYVSGDYEGDHKNDLAFWNPATGKWHILKSSNNQSQITSWGSGIAPYYDVPVPGDYDGDGKADLAVWRKQDGKWYVVRSSDNQNQVTAWGDPATDIEVHGDYDGDGKTDLAVWRKTDGKWYVLRSSNGQSQATAWGSVNAPYYDIPVPGDYDGDGKTDLAVWRKQDNNWYILKSSTGQYQITLFGDRNTDIAVPADYDGDGKTDIAVWRKTDGTWRILKSSTGQIQITPWGSSLAPYYDVPVPGDYDGDGKTDLAIWRADGNWYILRSSDGQYRIILWPSPDPNSISIGSDTFSIGPRETVVSKAARDAAGLIHWTDGQLGVVPTGNGEYDFYSGHGPDSAKTHGTLDNPIQSVVTIKDPIKNLIRKSDYASGGPIYRDSATGKLVKIYHAEHWLSPGGQSFHSWLGMAVSQDNGDTWTDLGTIVNVEVPLEVLSDIGSGQYMIIGGHLYVYFHDFLHSTPVGVGTLAVARTPLSEISAAIQQGRAPVFMKYYNGAWTEPGLGGKSSAVVASDARGNWGYPTVSYNTYLNKYVMALFLGEWEDWRLYLSTSDNALNWSTPVLIDFEPKIGSDPNRAVYQILVDDGPDPYRSDKDFYLYYLHSTTTNGWQSAELVRKKITVTSS